ncbi:MAG: hypothetical protein KGL39_06295 [Patescibacteria group bacterium]|nr:hypothetical protein [Patescibacteria group bacterium]
MHRNIFAWTAPGANYPAFVSINDRGADGITLDARGPVQPDGKCGETIQITLPVRQLAEIARALVCEVIPADIAP